jgi:hypothetical protein
MNDDEFQAAIRIVVIAIIVIAAMLAASFSHAAGVNL